MQDRDHDASEPTPGFAGADRGFGVASVLVASLVPRLTDIVEAIEHIRNETAGTVVGRYA